MSAGTGTRLRRRIFPRLCRHCDKRVTRWHRRHAEDVQAVWDRLEERLGILAAPDSGEMRWAEVYDPGDLPPGTDMQTAAIELAERECAELRLELLTAGRAS